MLIASWSNFFGANRQLTSRRLPDGIGVECSNLRPGFADLRGWKGAQTVVTTGGATPLISAYRMDRAVISDVAEWLQWTSDVDVVRSLVANDTSEEIYYTGDGAPKLTNMVLALPTASVPAASRPLGIPKPTVAMTATRLVVGTGASENRVYVDTFYSSTGRESAPGVPTSFVDLGGTTVTLSAFGSVPSGYPDVTIRRIYCSTDGGDFLLVAEQPASTATCVDSLGRGGVLQSGGRDDKPAWEEPPSNLSGLIGLWNGMIGGFFGKSWAVCEPYKPWAWPVLYQNAVFDDIVGTGKWLQNWLVLTTGQPYLVAGSAPASMNDQPMTFDQACASKRSIVSMGHGVCWASPRGLCYVGEGVAPTIITDGILSAEQWEAMSPSTMIASRYERFYACFYNDGSLKGFLIDPRNPTSIIDLTQGARGCYFDPISERLYLQDVGNVIRRFNHPSASALTVGFKTGSTRHPYPTNPGAAMLVANEPVSVVFTLFANLQQTNGTYVWTQVFQRTVTTGVPFTLPGGYLAQEFQVSVSTSGPLQGILLAEGMEDLA